MSSDRPNKPHAHATTWTSLIVAVPLLYFLTLAPLWFVLDPPWDSTPRPSHLNWMDWYIKPYLWIYEHTPVSRPLQAYADLWYDALCPLRSGAPVPIESLDAAVEADPFR